MKKLLLFIAGISILFLAGCYNGNQSHGNEGMGEWEIVSLQILHWVMS